MFSEALYKGLAGCGGHYYCFLGVQIGTLGLTEFLEVSKKIFDVLMVEHGNHIINICHAESNGSVAIIAKVTSCLSLCSSSIEFGLYCGQNVMQYKGQQILVTPGILEKAFSKCYYFPLTVFKADKCFTAGPS